MPGNKKFGIALIQMNGCGDRDVNVAHAVDLIRDAVKKYSPKIVCLPECFNSPYAVDQFDKFAEYIPAGYTSQKLSAIAKELKIYLLGGTIPERDEHDKKVLYNTATMWGPDGQLIVRHRKAHLFDIDIKEANYSISESAAFTPGKTLTTFTIEGIKFGMGICFDIYFDEYCRALRNAGCDMILFPNAFNTVIGPLHWDLLNRARATDNQLYVASISPARDDHGGYISWGYSMFSDPWGRVLAQAGIREEIIFQEIDFGVIPSLREQIPIFGKRRLDIYSQAGSK